MCSSSLDGKLPNSVELVPVETRQERRAFLELPYELYRRDPAFVPPLRLVCRDQIDPRKNAFFEHADVALMVARRSGRPTGRISMHVDRLEEETWGVRGATFGLFEAFDRDSALALLEAAETWARKQGARRLRGPFSLSINQESGFLIDGFESRPAFLMPHSRREYPEWVEEAGFRKAMDLLAHRVRLTEVPPLAMAVAERLRRSGRVQVRTLDPRRLQEDLRIVRMVFNSAWSNNWGFLPMTDGELDAMARDLRWIIDPRMALIFEAQGEPIGIGIALPNLNEALIDLDGRLLPFGWLKLLWRARVRGLHGVRLALMGAVESWRGMRGLGLAGLQIAELVERGLACGYHDWELSWILEDNTMANQAALVAGAGVAKTYRVYEKSLG